MDLNVLREKLDHEMNEFQASYKDMSSTEVYNDWYIIGFHESHYEVLTSDYFSEQVSSNLVDWLAKKETPISYLYQKWMSCDGEMSHSWDDMIDWIVDVYLEEKQELHNSIASLGLKNVRETNDEYFEGFGCFCHISNEPLVFSPNNPYNVDKEVDKEFAKFFNEKLFVKSCDYACDTYPNGITRVFEGLGEYTFKQQVWDFIDATEQVFDCECLYDEGYNGFEFAFEFGEGENKGCYVFAAGNNGQEYTETLYLTNPELIREDTIRNTIISIDKALYTLLEEYGLKREAKDVSLEEVIKGAEAKKDTEAVKSAPVVEQER